MYLCFSLQCNKDSNSYALRNEEQSHYCKSKHPTLIFSLKEVIEKIKNQDEQTYNEIQEQFKVFFESNQLFQQIYGIFSQFLNIDNLANQQQQDQLQNYFSLIDKSKCIVQFNGYQIIQNTLVQVENFKQNFKKFEELLKHIKLDSFTCVNLKQSQKNSNSQNKRKNVANSSMPQANSDQNIHSQQSQQSNQFNSQIQQTLKNDNQQSGQIVQQVETINQQELSNQNASAKFQKNSVEQKPQARLYSQTQKVEYQEQDEIKKQQKKNIITNQLLYQFVNQNSNLDSPIADHSTTAISAFQYQQDNSYTVKKQSDELIQNKIQSGQSKNSLKNENIVSNQNAKNQKKYSRNQKNLLKGQQRIDNLFIKLEVKNEGEKQNEDEQQKHSNNQILQNNQNQISQPEVSIEIQAEEDECIYILDDDDDYQIQQKQNKLKKELQDYLEKHKEKNKKYQKLVGSVYNTLYAKKGSYILKNQINDKDQKSLEESITNNCFCIIESKNIIISISFNKPKLFLLKFENGQRKHAQLKYEGQLDPIEDMSCCYNQAKDCLFLSILKKSEVVYFEISMNKLDIIKQFKYELDQTKFQTCELTYQIRCEVSADRQNNQQYIIIINDFQTLQTLKIEQSDSNSLVVNQNDYFDVQEGISFVKCLKIKDQLQVFLGTSQQTLQCFKIDRNNLYQKINKLQHGISSDCFAIDDNNIAVVVQKGIIIYDLNKQINDFKFTDIPLIFSAIKSNQNIIVSFEKEEIFKSPFSEFINNDGQLIKKSQ